MQRKELERFTYEDIEYIIGVDFIYDNVPSPFILVTTKSSKKRRGKSTEKADGHYKRITLKNPIGFYRKVYPIFKEELIKYDIVHFAAYTDFRFKREEVYQIAIEKMGFKLFYVHKGNFFLIKEKLKIKRKVIKRIIDSLVN